MRSIADNIPDLVGYWDAARVLRFANRPYEAWYDCGSGVVGLNRTELFGDPDEDPGERAFAAALGGGGEHIGFGGKGAVVGHGAILQSDRGIGRHPTHHAGAEQRAALPKASSPGLSG